MFSLAWFGLHRQKIFFPWGRNSEAGSDLFHPPSFIVLTGRQIPHSPLPAWSSKPYIRQQRGGCAGELGAHWQNLPSRCFQLNVLWSGNTFSASVLDFLQSAVGILSGEIISVSLFLRHLEEAGGARNLQNKPLFSLLIKVTALEMQNF